MELTNDFRVAVPPATAWAVLTDVERIAPCMPGAQLQEVEGDDYRGIVKVKVGPITAQYKGTATFLERDEAGNKLVLRAEGRETRGQGNASATITATLAADGDGTRVSVVTDLTVTGKVAQFGRGVMADVSAKLLDQFVACLETKVLAGDSGDGDVATGATSADPVPAPVATPAPGPVDEAEPVEEAAREEEADLVNSAATTAGAEPAPTSAPIAPDPVAPAATSTIRKIDSPEPQPVDLLDAAGSPVAKRVAPLVGLLAIGWLLRVLIRRRRK